MSKEKKYVPRKQRKCKKLSIIGENAFGPCGEPCVPGTDRCESHQLPKAEGGKGK